MSSYPGDERPQQDDTEPTQPVGYWERQAAEQARAQQANQQPPAWPGQARCG